MERRARAFAVYLLAPLEELERIWKSLGSTATLSHRVRVMMERFGMGYEAVRSHLENARLLGLRRKMAKVSTETPAAWNERDPLPVHTGDALTVVPLPRRGELLNTALRAWQAQVLTESGVRDALRVPLADWPAVKESLVARKRETHVWATSYAALGPPTS